MDIDLSKSLAELLCPPVSTYPEKVRVWAAEQHRWLTTPLAKLPAEGIWRLLKSGPGGHRFLMPLAIDHLERDPGLHGLLTTVHGQSDYPWLDHPDDVGRLRGVVASAMSQLNEWDNSEEVVIAAMRQTIPILEAWACFERHLSLIP